MLVQVLCLQEIALLRKIRHECIAEYVDFCWASLLVKSLLILVLHYRKDCGDNGALRVEGKG